MKFKKHIFLMMNSLLLVGCFQMVYAQSDSHYTQYMYNTGVINPAYGASVDGTQLFGLHRTQWVGLNGAPHTTNIGVVAPMGASNWGIGGNVVAESIGALAYSDMSVDVSYRVDLNRDYSLAFGLKGAMNFMSVDYTKMDIKDINDVVVSESVVSRFTPNIGVGVFMYSDKVYVGVSVPSFIKRRRFVDGELAGVTDDFNLFFIGGYVARLSDVVVVKPAVLFKTVGGNSLLADISANVMLYEKVTMGASYHWDSAVSALAGVQINSRLFVGYSYDASTNKLGTVNGGSHELFIRFDFNHRKVRRDLPRYF